MILFKNKWTKVILLFFVSGFLLTSSVNDKDFEITKNLDIFITLYKELNQNYVDELIPGELIKIAIDKMLESLDPYTVFISESEIEDYRFMTTGQYGGIGALIQKIDNQIVISEPYEGFPAFEAGLRAGDIILEINGKTVAGKNISEVSEMLKGAPGSEVQVLVRHPITLKEEKYTIIRKEIKINNVPYSCMVHPEVGYIKLTTFTQGASQNVRTSLEKLRTENPEMKGLILDLRGNTGGLLHEAVNLVNLFVDKGIIIVQTRGKIQEANKTYKTLNHPVDKNLRLVVLIDGNSASASEIVAGSIQDLDRGVIIGQKSFGKGLVQNIIPLVYNTSLKVTIAKYYIPSGRCIQAIDYSHKEKGSPIKLPDSVQRTFYTKNGRPVKDAGGILPDISIPYDSLSNISVALLSKNHIFNYATLYVYEHPQKPMIENFSLSDEEYQKFINYLQDKDFDYTTRTEKKLLELKQTLEDEKYFQLVSSEFELIRQKVSHDKNRDLILFKNEIKRLLEVEIISRYYFQKGRIQYDLSDDKEIKEAIEILTNEAQYKKILQKP
ncbi:MAG: S41 family peptidase [Bacteroidales bacterium]|nr:S41 family peptidase [Bacteroidales bacterium]